MEFTKSERKLARQVIEIGLQIEFANGLKLAEKVVQNWQNNQEDNREAYYALYQTVIDFDKHIARRYDNMSGSTYIWVVIDQLRDNLITEEDLAVFSPATRQALLMMSRR
jgi:hypothetical protein